MGSDRSTDSVALVLTAFGKLSYAVQAALSAVRGARRWSISSSGVWIFEDAGPLRDDSVRRMREALGNVRFVRRAVSGGCTSGWNDGLVWARLEGFSTVLLANDDVVFGPGWDVGLDEALRDADLVGPLSNAPGLTSPAVQGVRRLLPAYEPSDDPDKIREVSEALTSLGAPPEKAPVNGFCMAGRVASLWRCAYSDEFVFDPKFPMEGNETEFQNRASVLGFRTSVSSTSFVFHYRSVSRSAKNRRGLWFRPSRGGFDW